MVAYIYSSTVLPRNVQFYHPISRTYQFPIPILYLFFFFIVYMGGGGGESRPPPPPPECYGLASIQPLSPEPQSRLEAERREAGSQDYPFQPAHSRAYIYSSLHDSAPCYRFLISKCLSQPPRTFLYCRALSSKQDTPNTSRVYIYPCMQGCILIYCRISIGPTCAGEGAIQNKYRI